MTVAVEDRTVRRGTLTLTAPAPPPNIPHVSTPEIGYNTSGRKAAIADTPPMSERGEP
jgi:hypothetical protein